MLQVFRDSRMANVRMLSCAFVMLLGAPLAAQDGPEFLPLEGSSTPFSEAVQVGDTLYLAGKLGTAADGSGLVLGAATIEGTRRATDVAQGGATQEAAHG